MKKFALGMLAAVAMTGSAFAADMAPRYAKAPPPAPVVVYSWTGCYIGGNVGGGWARTSAGTSLASQAGAACSCGSERLPAMAPAALHRWRSDRLRLPVRQQLGVRYRSTCTTRPDRQQQYQPGVPDVHRIVRIKDYRHCYRPPRLPLQHAIAGYVKGGGAWTRSDYSINYRLNAARFDTGIAVRDSLGLDGRWRARVRISLPVGPCSASSTTWTSCNDRNITFVSPATTDPIVCSKLKSISLLVA